MKSLVLAAAAFATSLPYQTAAAKPCMMVPAREIDGCLWIAQVEVLDVKVARPAKRIAGGGGGLVRVRVSDDPAKVFRGFDLMGREIDLKPNPSGPLSCTDDFHRMGELEKHPLVAVRRDGSIAFIGERRKDSYILWHWCDHNAALMYSLEDDPFGQELERKDGDWERRFEVGHAAVRHRLARDYLVFLTKVEHWLEEPDQDPAPEKIKAWVRDLGADNFATRRAAEHGLSSLGPAALPALRTEVAATGDAEVKARLQKVINQFGTDLSALRHASRLWDGMGAEKALQLVRAERKALAKKAGQRRPAAR